MQHAIIALFHYFLINMLNAEKAGKCVSRECCSRFTEGTAKEDVFRHCYTESRPILDSFHKIVGAKYRGILEAAVDSKIYSWT